MGPHTIYIRTHVLLTTQHSHIDFSTKQGTHNVNNVQKSKSSPATQKFVGTFRKEQAKTLTYQSKNLTIFHKINILKKNKK